MKDREVAIQIIKDIAKRYNISISIDDDDNNRGLSGELLSSHKGGVESTEHIEITEEFLTEFAARPQFFRF